MGREGNDAAKGSVRRGKMRAWLILSGMLALQLFRPMMGKTICRTWSLSGEFGAVSPEGRRFESHSSRHIGTLGKFRKLCLNKKFNPQVVGVALILNRLAFLRKFVVVKTIPCGSFNTFQPNCCRKSSRTSRIMSFAETLLPLPELARP